MTIARGEVVARDGVVVGRTLDVANGEGLGTLGGPSVRA
jgi:hypothetical protein